jgi:hypothetical protein
VMCGRGFRQNEQTESDCEKTVEHTSHECLLRKSCWPDCFVLLTRILLCLFQISHTPTPPTLFYVSVHFRLVSSLARQVLIPRSVKFVPMGIEAGVKLQATLRENAFSD